MSDFTVAVIWRPRPNMAAAFERAQRWWASQGVTPVFVDSPLEDWSCAAARNRAVREYGKPGVPLVLCDADTHPAQITDLRKAVAECARNPDAVYLPYTLYSVRNVVTGGVIADFDWSVSGMFVTTPGAWWSVGGQDERFTRWSPEDFAFTMAHTAILGEPLRRVPGTVIAYGHPSNPGKDEPQLSKPLSDLFERYKATTDIDAMIALVNEWHTR